MISDTSRGSPSSKWALGKLKSFGEYLGLHMRDMRRRL